MARTKRLALALVAGSAALAVATPALADSVEYFHAHATGTNVPTLLPQSDRDYYRDVFSAIDKEDWKKVQEL
ncbi:MAG TPA: hypothetical protein VL017_02750, partial [Devosia sp.]|nr:hypothetical protein [Devosia sp.]